LSKLPDGDYFLDIDNIIIDTKGKIVYYDYQGIFDKPLTNKEMSDGVKQTYLQIADDIKKPLGKKIEKLFTNAPVCKPGQKDGKPVISRTDINFYGYRITVKSHAVTYVLK
jgi:hypothetical protein